MKAVQKFIGFANFYRGFIQDFSKLTVPIQILTQNGVIWNWPQQCQEAFEELKHRFMTTRILCHYHPERRKQIDTDVLDLAKAGILSQYEPDKH